MAVEGSLGFVGARRFGPEGSGPTLVEIVNRVADGLVIAAKGSGNGRSRLPCDAGKQHLAAADGKTSRRPKPGFQRRLLLGREGPDKK